MSRRRFLLALSACVVVPALAHAGSAAAVTGTGSPVAGTAHSEHRSSTSTLGAGYLTRPGRVSNSVTEFTVPSTCGSDGAALIGLSTFDADQRLQSAAGVLYVCSHGKPTVHEYTQDVPSGLLDVTQAVRPGDVVQAEIYETGSLTVVDVNDESRNAYEYHSQAPHPSIDRQFLYGLTNTSDVSRPADLPDFGRITFAEACTSSTTHPQCDVLDRSLAQKITDVVAGATRARASQLDDGAGAFTVVWQHP